MTHVSQACWAAMAIIAELAVSTDSIDRDLLISYLMSKAASLPPDDPAAAELRRFATAIARRDGRRLAPTQVRLDRAR
jgi:hypothetical protein